MAGAVAGSRRCGPRGIVSAARRRAVPVGCYRPCLHAKRTAARANAAARICGAVGVAGGAGLCRTGAERPGHGATGGKYLEDQGGCDEANYSRAGHATADSIAAALNFLREQPFIRRDGTVVVGHSAGAWGALALAGSNPKGVSGIVAFAPGRGGRANDFPNQVCAPRTLISAAAEFGHDARVPVIWLVSANDTYFSPELSRQLADAFRAGGGKVDFRVLAAYGGEGHWLAETDGGIKVAAPELERALKAPSPAAAKKR